jgi:hypothetical protein
VVIGVVCGPVAAHAAIASPSYQDAYASSSPTGYSVTPARTAVGSGILYEFDVWNPASSSPPRLSGKVYAERVTAVDGSDVSTGFPAITEDDLLQATVAADPPVVIGTLDHAAIPAAWPSLSFAVHTVANKCGYFVLWAGSADSFSDPSRLLNAGVVRVTGCPAPAATAQPAPSPLPSPPAVSGLSPYEGGYLPRDPATLIPTTGGVVDRGIRGEGPVIAATVILAGSLFALSWTRGRRRLAGSGRTL